jgi:hypothetical protein
MNARSDAMEQAELLGHAQVGAAFSRAYARWLKALAQREDPDRDDDDFVQATFIEERAALRALYHAPADHREDIWAKLAAFETDLVREHIAGPAKDSLLLFGLGSIKADLMNIGIDPGEMV